MSALENIKSVKQEIEDAAKRTGRAADEIQLVAVSKTVDIDIIRQVYDGGQQIFGESYVQEFIKKQDILPEINWHFIGQLQSNKVKYIVEKIKLLHSLDRLSLATELSKRYTAQNTVIDSLIQVNIGEEVQKGGTAPDELFRFMDSVLELGGVNVCGLMCIHPYEEPEECRKYFARMYEMYEKAIDRGYKLKYLSMGMSSDYVQAIEEGSNIVRVGSAIFGSRK
ncbi:MAG: YggS family pyridoxal phosphate-dependent enzyme [Eubacteriales bacterium]